jgi:hypothetical protein
MLLPAVAAVGRSVVGFAGVAGAMHHDHRPSAGFLLLRDGVLDVHLVDDDAPAGIAATGIVGLDYLAIDEKAAGCFEYRRRRRSDVGRGEQG